MHGDGLLSKLSKAEPRKEENAADVTLPDYTGPYEAYGRAANQSVYSVHFLLGPDELRSFQYAHLDSDSALKIAAGGQVVVLRFRGTRTTEVTLRGRNLRYMYDILHQHRLPWIARADRDFPDGAGKKPIVTHILFEEIKEPDRG
jgi:hypothetical protein